MENKKSNNQSYTYQLATLTEEPEEQKGGKHASASNTHNSSKEIEEGPHLFWYGHSPSAARAAINAADARAAINAADTAAINAANNADLTTPLPPPANAADASNGAAPNGAPLSPPPPANAVNAANASNGASTQIKDTGKVVIFYGAKQNPTLSSRADLAASLNASTAELAAFTAALATAPPPPPASATASATPAVAEPPLHNRLDLLYSTLSNILSNHAVSDNTIKSSRLILQDYMNELIKHNQNKIEQIKKEFKNFNIVNISFNMVSIYLKLLTPTLKYADIVDIAVDVKNIFYTKMKAGEYYITSLIPKIHDDWLPKEPKDTRYILYEIAHKLNKLYEDKIEKKITATPELQYEIDNKYNEKYASHVYKCFDKQINIDTKIENCTQAIMNVNEVPHPIEKFYESWSIN